MWVYNTTASTQITNAQITYYYPSSLGTLRWSSAAGNTGWSVPVVDGSVPQKPGYTAYTSYYTGGWQFVDNPGVDNDYTYATGQPHFTAAISNNACSRDILIYARRSVVVDGETIAFERGPVEL